MFRSNQVFFNSSDLCVLQVLSSSEPPANTCNWQMQKQGRVRGQREVSWSSRGEESGEEERARKCLWATLLKCQLLWIKTLTNVPFELQFRGEQRAGGCCSSSIRIEICKTGLVSPDRKKMQRRHSASTMGRHQDNPRPSKQVWYWLNRRMEAVGFGKVCACCVCVCVCSHLISNDEMV